MRRKKIRRGIIQRGKGKKGRQYRRKKRKRIRSRARI